MAEYKGTVELIAGITQANGQDFALVNAPDIQVDNTGKKLNTKLTEIDNSIALKAPKDSPTFTGTPKSVTPSSNSDDKMIATKEYVDNSSAAAIIDVERLVYDGCYIYDPAGQEAFSLSKDKAIHEVGTGYICIWTINQPKTIMPPTHLPTSSGNGWLVYSIKSYIEAVKALADTKAPITSPSFTGTPFSVTPSANSNAKMIATKEYVDNSTPDVYYADCDISIDNMTTAEALISGAYNEKAGNIIVVNFTGAEGSTYSLSAEAKLQITYDNSESTTVAKYIYYGNTKKISAKMINVGDTCVFIYSGNSYTLVNPSMSGTIINDSTTTTDKTWSSNKINTTKANINNPIFTGSISMGRKANSQAGTSSIAVGRNSIASGKYSAAIGDEVEASGTASHAEGVMTKATSSQSHTEGYSTISYASNAHAEGTVTIAGGNNSHAEGIGTVTYESAGHVAGKYNTPSSATVIPAWAANKYYGTGALVKRNNNVYICISPHTSTSTFDSNSFIQIQASSSTYAEVIGNGMSNTYRSNARALDWEGNEYLAGDVYVNCSSDSTGGSKLMSVSNIASIFDTQAIIDEYGG